jgi:tetratricopeptide (TPR) repeat protein
MKLKFPYRPFIHLILIALLGLLAYSNTFEVPFQFDDHSNIVENPIIKDLSNFVEPSQAAGHRQYRNFRGRFFGFLTLALNYRFNGFDVTGYHVVNLAVHIANALLVYWMVMLTFRTPFMKESALESNARHIALFSALLFVSHPLQTQAVTYIVQRFASLASLFYLFSIVFYARCRIVGVLNIKAVMLYFLSLISALLAMQIKEIAFTLPVAIALYEFCFFRASFKKRLLFLVPLLLTISIIPVTLLSMSDLETATRLQTDMSRFDYLFTESRVVASYIRLFFFPINQNLDYDYLVYHTFWKPQIFLSSLFLLSIVGLGAYLLYRSRRREAVLRLTAFGIFWFFVTLSVESSLIPIEDVIFEHRMYLPSTGFFIAIATVAALVVGRADKERVRATAVIVLCLVPLVFASAAYVRNKVWHSEVSLWEDVVRKSPNKARPHYELAVAYDLKDRTDEAIVHYLTALRLKPDYTYAHIDLGIAYSKKGKLEEAAEHFKAALKLRPDLKYVHNNLGTVYLWMGLVEKAREEFEADLRSTPPETKHRPPS